MRASPVGGEDHSASVWSSAPTRRTPLMGTFNVALISRAIHSCCSVCGPPAEATRTRRILHPGAWRTNRAGTSNSATNSNSSFTRGPSVVSGTMRKPSDPAAASSRSFWIACPAASESSRTTRTRKLWCPPMRSAYHCTIASSRFCDTHATIQDSFNESCVIPRSVLPRLISRTSS